MSKIYKITRFIVLLPIKVLVATIFLVAFPFTVVVNFLGEKNWERFKISNEICWGVTKETLWHTPNKD